MLLTTLLPQKLATSRWRVFWLALLVLAPLAYAGGSYLYLKINPNAQVRLSLDRTQAFAKAAAYLSANGLNVAGWPRYCNIEPDDDLQRYLNLTATPESKAARAQARRYVAPLTLKVLFHKADNTQIAEVLLGPAGQPLGFRRTLWQTDKQPDLSPAEAQRLAEQHLRARPEAAFANFSAAPKVREVADKGDLTRHYTWAWQVAGLAELNAQTSIAIYGKQVIGEVIQTQLDPAFARQALHADRPLRLSSIIAFSLALTLAVIFGIYRFVKRARQKELSYARIFFITGFLAVVLNLFVILTDTALYQTAQLPVTVPAWVIYVTSGIMWTLGGLFIGLAYGSGEGDLREAYPGKLTSIDTLILGKFLSRNVGRAALWGCALGGWLWLAFQLVGLWFARQPGAGEALLPFIVYFAEWPVLLVLTSWQTDVVLVAVIGLLLPLPFLRRLMRPAGRITGWLNRLGEYLPANFMTESRMGNWVIALLAVWAWIIAQLPLHSFHPWTGMWLLAALKTVVLLTVFFKFDLLTAAAALAAPIYLKFTLTAWLQPAPAIHQAGVLAALIAVLVLPVLFYCAVKGRWYRDEDVRPVYAGLLAERLSLQAEVSAARVAQERLLPQRLPISPNFTVAASCVPAHEVGGDFYDFFEVGPHQIAMLVAEGGGRGLGSALSIAYAKGFLMSKVGGQSNNQRGGDDSPTEVMRALQERLTQMLTHDDAIGLAYLVLDTSDGVLRYARTGKFPQVLLGRANPTGKAPEVMSVSEHEIKFSSHHADKAAIRVIEGRAEVETGDHLIVYTGGLVEVWQNSNQTPENEFARLLTQADESHQLQAALVESVNRCFKLVRKQELGDDLTAVVVRVEQVGVPFEMGLAETQAD